MERALRSFRPLFQFFDAKAAMFENTGIEINPDNFELPSDSKAIQCPFCREEHVWTKRDALLDPDRWSEDPETEDCFIKAAENSERAASTQCSEERGFYLQMERKWLKLADTYRWIADIAQLRQAVDTGRVELTGQGKQVLLTPSGFDAMSQEEPAHRAATRR
jgi:hypothetical protein